jgi:octopine/nopaline transport system substrate-binding protein
MFAALALGAVVLAFGGAAEAKDWKKIRIATEGAYAPWNATDSSGKLIGFEVDLARDLCKRMNAECEVVAQDWDGIIPALQQGKYDAIMAGMSATDERRKVIDFAGPYATEPSVFAAMKGNALLSIKVSPEKIDMKDVTAEEKKAIEEVAAQLKGKTIGAQVSTIQQRFLEQLMTGVTVRTYDKVDNIGLDLVAGRIDGMFADLSAIAALQKEGNTKDIVLFGPQFTRGVLGDGVAVGLRKKDDDLKKLFEKAIAEAAQDGTTTKLSNQWFGFDIAVKQ